VSPAGVAGAVTIGLAALVLPGAAARAQPAAGAYAGTIQCDALPGLRALKTAVTMTVADGRARYEREILHPTGGPSGTFERGEGPVSADGAVTVATRATGQGYSYEAEYRGLIGEKTARFAGTQRWKLQRESGTILRACTLELTRTSP
jgi:hypothetical protein